MPEPAAPFSRLYPILDAATEELDALEALVPALARAGCRLLQLRAKELSGREFHDWALRGVASARGSGIKVLVNDRVDVALLTGADGVHLGQDDLSPRAARRVLGERALIGLSTHDVAQARAAREEPVDYIAIGPAFATDSKRDHDPPLGVEGIREVRRVVARPLVAIGGITLDAAPGLLATGVDGLAVISGLRGGDIEEIAREWLAVSRVRAATDDNDKQGRGH